MFYVQTSQTLRLAVVLVSLVSLLFSFVYALFPFSSSSVQFWTDQGPFLLAASAALAGSFGLFWATYLAGRVSSFSEIDDRTRQEKQKQFDSEIATTIRVAKDAGVPIDYDKIEEIYRKAQNKDNEARVDAAKSFVTYFHQLSAALESKAVLYDEKASILLDRGTLYARMGIAFFVATIVAWQIISYLTGFQKQYIYGIVSCSVLFVFVEFLAAWFLKQYSQFVDTSTYLIKIKSIFDKYLLAYLCVKEMPTDQKNRMEPLIALLSEDIRWPDTYLLKNADVSFARESMDTMSHLMRTMKDQVKSTASTNKKHESIG
ncbi:hypothetical protein [Nitratireductor sp. XY-223]|uniref:hypothetical protein n=1 Tax=Nitratireductor sp. XY-223 TaxID=2561926 RepID=UPI0010A9D234|nr:hypothetical protein [Nitratireductor sp. XY-223]